MTKFFSLFYILMAASYCFASLPQDSNVRFDSISDELQSLRNSYEELKQQIKDSESKEEQKEKIAPEKRVVAFLLVYLMGTFGAHRFYVRKYTTACLQLITLGGLGVWTFIDMILIILGKFRNAEDELLVDWV